MSKKKPSIPKIFLKQYSPKKFKKKILKRIHIPQDREMVKGLFLPADKGKLAIRKDLEEQQISRLTLLAKTIKKNKGTLSTWKAVLLLVIVGTGTVFSIFFKNTVIKNQLERGLESAFKAQSTVENPKLSLLKGEFSYDSLQIADEQDLSRNLMETGPARFRISIAELTRKRIHIEETSLTGVQWDTERESEALPLVPEENDKDESGEEGASSLDILALTPEEMDYNALLEDQKENLQSLNLINSGNEQIEEFTAKWTGLFEEKEAEIRGLTAEVQSLQTIRVQDIRSIEEGQAALDRIESVYPSIEQTSDSLISLQRDFEAEKERLTGLYDQVETAIEEDIAYLSSLLDFSSGDIRSLASSAAEKYIRNRWNDYYEKGLKAWEAYERFRAGREAAASETEDQPAREGRIIPFPSPDLPDVLVKQILLSGGTEETGLLTAEIDSLTDAPDKWDQPSSFLVQWGKENSSIELEGLLDGRTGTDRPFYTTIRSPRNALRLDEGVPALQISRLNSLADITGETYAVPAEKGVLTELNITLSSIEILQDDPDGFIAQAVTEIMSGIDQVVLEARILITRQGIEDVGIDTDLDQILADRIGGYLKDLASGAEEELRQYLTDYLTPFLEDNQALQSVMDALGADSLDQISSVEGLENLLDSKKDEITGQTTAILDAAKAEAARLQAEAEQRAREEAARLQAEAEQKAQEEAARLQQEAQKALEDAASDIKLPGF